MPLKVKFVFWLVVVQLALSQASLTQAAREVTDQTGRHVSVPDNPQRVVSLAPSITEIVYALGQEDKLVGATLYSDYPEPALEIPRVGSYVRLDLEKIVSLKPDLCLAIKDGNPEHTIERIEKLGIPIYVIDPRNLNEIMLAINELGALLKSEKQAAVLIQDIRERLNHIQEKISRAAAIPRVFIQITAAPITTAGKDTFINELINLAGGSNLAADKAGYHRYSWEDVLRLEPDVVIIATMAEGQSPEYLKSLWKNWSILPAVKNKRVHVIEAAIINRPTPRLLDGLEQIVEYINPGI